MEILEFSSKVKCAGRCGKHVRVHNSDKSILCKKCWHEKAEQAALSSPSMMHVAFSDQPHELTVIDHMQEFMEEYDIERPEG